MLPCRAGPSMTGSLCQTSHPGRLLEHQPSQPSRAGLGWTSGRRPGRGEQHGLHHLANTGCCRVEPCGQQSHQSRAADICLLTPVAHLNTGPAG